MPALFEIEDTLQPRLIPVEVNLEGFPLFSRQKTPEGTAIEVRQSLSTEDGRTVNQLWRVTANVDFTLPGTYDEDVFVGVMALVKQRGGMPADGLIRFSVYELMKVLGKAKNGENNRKIKESLDRIGSTTYYSENAFYVAEDESLETFRFTLWDVHFSRARGRHGRSAEHHTLGFNKTIIRSYNAGYLKLLDTDLYFALKLPLAKALYRLVDQRRREAKSWSVEARELRDLLAMSKKYEAPSRIFEVLDKAHRALRRERFLESASLQGETIRYKVHPDFARDWFPERAAPPTLEEQAVAALKGMGVHPPRARKLVEAHGPEKALHAIEVARMREDVRNPGGYVAGIVEKGNADELAEMAEFLNGRKALEAAAEVQPPLSNVDGELLPGQPGRQGDGGDGGGGDADASPSRYHEEPEAAEMLEAVLEDVGGDIDETSLRVWFQGTFACGLADGALSIVVPNYFASEYIATRFGTSLEAALRRRLGPDASLQVLIGQRA